MRRARQGFALLRCFERSPCPNEHVLLCLARPFAANAVALKPSHSGPPTASSGEWGGPGATEQRLRQTVGLTEVSAVVDAAGLVWKVRHTTSDGLKKDGDGAKPDSTAARRLLQPVQSVLRCALSTPCDPSVCGSGLSVIGDGVLAVARRATCEVSHH